MPQLGLSMDSGGIIQWLKESGDRIEAGDLLLEVESDKATIEVEAVESGILHIVRGPEDGDIPVGGVIAYLLVEGESPPVAREAVSSEAMVVASEAASGVQASTSTVSGGNAPQARSRLKRLPASPAARRHAKELGIDWRLATGTGPGGSIIERDVIKLAASPKTAPREAEAAAVAVTEKVPISPVARRLAEAVGMDIRELGRRYPGKRVERADVEQAIRELLAAAKADQPVLAKVADRTARREQMSRMRRLIAKRMAGSAHTTAAVTLTTEADAGELVRVREGWKGDLRFGVVPSYNALLAKLVATALLKHPELNASLDGDEIVYWDVVNIGVAVDAERGLVVPVVDDVQTKSIRELATEMDRLLSRAKDGKAVPDELTGGTFTITNLGVYEIDGFTPIINAPECAVLGVGRLVEKMVVREGAAAIRTMLTLSLTFDHRLVDGGPAARFLQRVKQFVEQPYLWLV